MAERTKRLKARLMDKWPTGQQLVRTLGARPAGELFDVVLASGMVTPQINDRTKTDEQVLKIVDYFLELEIENVVRTGRIIGKLAADLTAGGLAAIARDHAMDGGTYQAAASDSDTMRAAKWVCHASNTTRDKRASIVETNNIVVMAVAARTPLNQLNGIDYINQLLLGQGGRAQPRSPVISPRSPLPSSPGGRRLLEIAVQYLGSRTPGSAGCPWDDLACYLLGSVIACHGFTDANGRTGRVLYAICRLRGGKPFVGITSDGERGLTGLPA